MPYRVSKSFEIENGHMLSKHPDHCRFPHGHTRTVEIVLSANELDVNDMVCDFKAIKGAIKAFLDSWDHAMCLNTEDPQYGHLRSVYGERIIPFPGEDPTSEVMARVIFDEVKRRLAAEVVSPTTAYRVSDRVRLERVRVTETSSSWAEYGE